MAQCERTVSRHSRPIRHALASTSLGPLKYLERSLSISLSLSFSMYAPYRVSTSYLYCMCRICTIRSPPISLCGWEKRLIALNNAEAFRFFFRLAFGDGDEMRPNLLRQQKFRFYDAPMVVYPYFFADARLDAHNYRINNLSMEILKSVDAAMESGRAFSLAI